MSVSSRLNDMPVSAIRKLLPFANTAKANGVHIYHLNIGDPDIPTPEEMLNVLRNWKEPVVRYAPSRGSNEFLAASKRYYHSLGHTFLKEDDMIVSVGGSEALQWTMFGVCNPGEEILVFEPYYSNYNAIAVATGVKIVSVETRIEDGFHLPPREAILEKIGPNTKAILYTNPGNPTGTNYSKEEVELLVSIAKEKKIFLVSDEPYREYVFDGKQVSLLSYMQEIPEYAILLDTVSKRWALCGARIGLFVSLNKTLMGATMRLAMARLSAGMIDQAVAAALCDVPDTYLQGVVEEYKKRRDLLYDGLRAIPGVSLPKPEGAFYMMVSLPVDDAEDFAKFLLESFRNEKNETLMMAPGSGFYAGSDKGKNQVRLAYILNLNDLKVCLDILRAGLEAYKNKK